MKRADVVHEITNLKGEEGHKWVVDTYNSIKPLPRGYKLQAKDSWCAATVSAIFHKFGYDDIAEVGCPMMVEKARKAGIWIEDDFYVPKAGDLIMYDWKDSGIGDNQGTPKHVGIITKVADGKITVREGNKSGTVGDRTIDINGKFIRGFITPPYDDDTAYLDKESIISTPETPKPQEKPQESSQGYIIGKVYTVKVLTALNVRRGAGTNYALVGYAGLTADGKLHANALGALKNGTRVTCKEIKEVGDSIWMRIPSGWICAVDNGRVYVK